MLPLGWPAWRQRGATAGAAAVVLGRAGVLRPYAPWKAAEIAWVLRQWGAGPAAGLLATAAREPHKTAIIDDDGSLTWAELRDRSVALARAFGERGAEPGRGVAVLCRNHRGFVEATMAACLSGSDLLLLNTALAEPQLTEILRRERPALLVADAEFDPVVTAALARVDPMVRLIADASEDDPDSLAASLRGRSTRLPPPPAEPARLVVLTSGTTGALTG